MVANGEHRSHTTASTLFCPWHASHNQPCKLQRHKFSIMSDAHLALELRQFFAMARPSGELIDRHLHRTPARMPTHRLVPPFCRPLRAVTSKSRVRNNSRTRVLVRSLVRLRDHSFVSLNSSINHFVPMKTNCSAVHIIDTRAMLECSVLRFATFWNVVQAQ